MTSLVVLRGLPASGKTTHARSWVASDPQNRTRVNRDELRMSLFGREGVLDRAQEGAVTLAENTMVRSLLGSRWSVVVDDMNMRPKYVRQWCKMVGLAGVDFETVEFPISVEEALSRDAQRANDGGRRVGKEAIERIASKFYPKEQFLPIPDEVLPPTGFEYEMKKLRDPRGKGRQPAIMVDMDGTLAHMRDRSPYDYSKVQDDSPDVSVVSVVQAMKEADWTVLVLSGRESGCWSETCKWLDNHLGEDYWDALIMRTEGDHRADRTVKLELYDYYIHDRYEVAAVFDDRWQVCQMWLEHGFKVFNVSGLDRGEF